MKNLLVALAPCPPLEPLAQALGLEPVLAHNALEVQAWMAQADCGLVVSQSLAAITAFAESLNQAPFGFMLLADRFELPPKPLFHYEQAPLQAPEIQEHRAKGLLERIWLKNRLNDQDRLSQEARAATANSHAVLEDLLGKLRQAKLHSEAEARQKTELVNFLAHEIRTPLSGIMGMVNWFADTPLNQEQKNFLVALSRSGHSLMELVNGFLDWGRMEAGELELVAKDFDLLGLVDELRLLFFSLAKDKGLAMRLQVSSKLQGWLHGDPSKLRQVLINLLGNAIKYTDQGEVALKVEPRFEGAVQIGITVEVADTGKGIAPELLDRLFEPFWQVEEFGAKENRGSGLGLAIVHKLVTLLGGKLEVHSQLGRGSNFILTLPIALGVGHRPNSPWPDGLDESLVLQGEVYLAALRHHLIDGSIFEAREMMERIGQVGQALGMERIAAALGSLEAGLGRDNPLVHLAQLDEIQEVYQEALTRWKESGAT